MTIVLTIMNALTTYEKSHKPLKYTIPNVDTKINIIVMTMS